jgi:3'-phosphoadenosine 5'-phosphosulfate (PAPS) 3'-phosphatase
MPAVILPTTITSQLTTLSTEVIAHTKKLIENGALNATTKEDGSWITDADIASHNVLSDKLPTIINAPVLSEEGFPDFESRRELCTYWLIDPIDNTKALVNNELSASSVSIALIVDGVPTLAHVTYLDGSRSFHVEDRLVALRSLSQPPQYLPPADVTLPLRFVGYCPSLSEMSEKTKSILQTLDVHDEHLVYGKLLYERFWNIISCRADIYVEPRPLPAWDVAPHICACLAQGGSAISLRTGQQLNFNSHDMRVDPFVVARRGIDTGEIQSRVKALLDR